MNTVCEKLVYTGGGFGGSLPNIPARDLTVQEVKQYGGADQLVASGLYARIGNAPAPTEPEIEQGVTEVTLVIDLRDGVNDDEATLAGKTLAARKKP